MHPIAFHLKRLHLSAVASERRLFRGTKKPSAPDFDGVRDMTPTRFDILYVIGGGRSARSLLPEGDSIAMAEVTRQLGLSRATVSVAIRRLVELGLVRKDAWSSHHGKRVALTNLMSHEHLQCYLASSRTIDTGPNNPEARSGEFAW